MNRVIVDRSDRIKIENSIMILNDIKIPLRSIEFLILSARSDISLKDISRIVKRDIPMLIVTSNPKEFILVQKQYFKNANIKYIQYRALETRLEIAKVIIDQKIKNSKKALEILELKFNEEYFMIDVGKVNSLKELLGIEGTIAKEYFKIYFSIFPKVLAKGKRSKNPPLDPVNAMLSYMYTIFYYELAARLNYMGFELTIGYLHAPFRGHFALASDLLELLRADIDIFVAQLFLEKTVVHSDFTKRHQGVYLTENGRKKIWPHVKNFLEEKESLLKTKIVMLLNLIKKHSF